MLPWIWKILAKCTFLIQIHQLQGSIHSDATPGCRVLIQAWVILHVSAALAECWLTNIDVFATAKITFIRGIGWFCRCGSPQCLIKPVFMKSMESHDWWDTELRRQQRLRPCPGLFDWKVGILEPVWAWNIISIHPAMCYSTWNSIPSPTEPQEMHKHPGAHVNMPGSAHGSSLAGKGRDEIRVTRVTMFCISHTASQPHV